MVWILGDGIKDVTKKYASDWLSSVKKIRLDESWWKNVLEPFQKEDCERDVKEEAYVHGKALTSFGLTSFGLLEENRPLPLLVLPLLVSERNVKKRKHISRVRPFNGLTL